MSDPELDKQLDELSGPKPPEAVADQWAEADENVINEQAYRGPLGLRGVELVLLRAHGLRELRGDPSALQERLADALPK